MKSEVQEILYGIFSSCFFEDASGASGFTIKVSVIIVAPSSSESRDFAVTHVHQSSLRSQKLNPSDFTLLLCLNLFFRFSKFYLPNSATSDVFRLSETSNIHIPGKWLYMASSRGVIQPDVRRGLAEDNIGALSEDVTLNDRRGRRSSSGNYKDGFPSFGACELTSTLRARKHIIH